MKLKKRVYLDYAAATPLSKEAKVAMNKVIELYGNPSAIHQEGVAAKKAIEASRKAVAGALEVKPEQVIFTSNGTEANNIGVLGTVEAMRASGKAYEDMEVITTKLEHPSLTKTILMLQKRGVTVVYAAVKESGKIDCEALAKILTPKTVLVATSYINSEIGTIQPLHQIKKVLKKAEAEFKNTIYLLIDAAQAPYWNTCQFAMTGADVLKLDFGKCGGPKGSGALVIAKRLKLSAITGGGPQESGVRPGTENLLAIAGGSAAFVAAQSQYKKRTEVVRAVRDGGIAKLSTLKGAFLNGATGDDRVANNINISVTGLDTEFLAVVLDSKGFAVSTKSACAGAGSGQSEVVRTITNDSTRARSTLRLTLGPDTAQVRFDEIVRIISAQQAQMEKLNPHSTI